tara:strand:+ start:861 stop:1031 length:171 start_codon:yes stop_codon:yes gene_type:complete
MTKCQVCKRKKPLCVFWFGHTKNENFCSFECQEKYNILLKKKHPEKFIGKMRIDIK